MTLGKGSLNMSGDLFGGNSNLSLTVSVEKLRFPLNEEIILWVNPHL